MYTQILMSLVLIASFNVNAGVIDCGYMDIGTFYVQSERSDGSSHGNKLIVALGNGCPSSGYVDNKDPAYASIMSIILAAKISKEQVRIKVNDGEQLSGAARIEMINFK